MGPLLNKPGRGKNLLVLAASLGMLWLALEWLFPYLLPYLPLKHHEALPPGIRVLAQSSKGSLLPRNYMALCGDSYAMGKGDWLWSVSGLANPAFGSAHVLRELSGRDVVSFGKGGAGSIDGLAIQPVSLFSYHQATGRFALPKPERFLVYFYEGNDLENNLIMAGCLVNEGCDPRRIRDPEYFQKVLAASLYRYPMMKEAKSMNVLDRLFFLRFVAGLVLRMFSPSPTEPGLDPKPGAVNRARINGTARALPDTLQGPGLELTGEDLQLSVYLFSQSLAVLMREFPQTPVTLVYLPSVLSCYDLASEDVSLESYHRRVFKAPAARVAARSEEIFIAIKKAAQSQGARVFDARPALRAAAHKAPVHGPRDWRHFNRIGYETLARALWEDEKQAPDPHHAPAKAGRKR